MARPVLPTDFKDDVLAESMAGKRRYRIIQNVDGTFSLEDVTQYDQIGSTFGAKQLNDMNEAFNDLPELKVANNDTTTEPGFVADARVVKTHGDEIDELKTLNFKDAGGDSTSQLELKQAVIYICENFVPLGKSGRGRFQCKSGWFDYDIIHAVDDYFSGIINGHTVSVTYAFHKMGRGADAVLKKLGNDSPNTITVNILKGNGRKSLEGMSSVVLTKQENGRYAVTSAPKSFGIRDGNGTVDWDYNMGGASITQE